MEKQDIYETSKNALKIGLPIVLSKVIASLNSFRTVLLYQHCHCLVIFFKINERKPEQKILNKTASCNVTVDV